MAGLLLAAASAGAASLNTLYTFSAEAGAGSVHFSFVGVTLVTNNDGANPQAGLILSGNTLYGTTDTGGTNGDGTLFKINTDGSDFTNFYVFTAATNNGGPATALVNSDGVLPLGDLVLSGGTLYGTAFAGGTNVTGTIFAVNTNGTGFTNLYTFSSPAGVDGLNPVAGLLLTHGMLYGTASGNGSHGSGTFFGISTNGTGYTNLYSFFGSPRDGKLPAGDFVLSGGTLYGTTFEGGSGSVGTVFSISTNGEPQGFLDSQLVNFQSTNGADAWAGPLLSGTTLYGATISGGTNNNGVIFKVNTDGSGFTNLYNFTLLANNSVDILTNGDGAQPYGKLILSSNMLYGTTRNGGLGGNGTIFALSTNGTGFTTLYSFSAGAKNVANLLTNSDGAEPETGLVLSSNLLYGTTEHGGTNGTGTVFALNLAASASPVPIPLNIQLTGGYVVLSWNDPSSVFSLYAAPAVTGTWTNVPSDTSPYTNVITGSQQFFRLQAN